MSPKLVYTAAAVAAALSLAAMPADAQDRRGGGRARARAEQSGGGSGGGERQDGGRRAVPRSSASRQESPARQAPRYEESRQAAAPQQAPQFSQGRRDQAAQGGSRSNQARANSGSRYSNGGNQAQGPRWDDRRGYAQPGGGYGRYGYRGYVRPPHFQPYRPYYFSRPYYGFRPHLHIGFGVWLGAPVPYPWAYFGTYRPRVYGFSGQEYYGRTYVGVAPVVQQYGGLSFDIQPSDADLFVDGEYVGPVGTFTPYGEPLTLWPGVHRIAIVRDGFRTMEWEVAIQPGQVIPYRGMLAR
jgi:hypothetical protein